MPLTKLKLLEKFEVQAQQNRSISYLDYGVLLRVDEGLEDDPDGHVDVVLVHVLAQVHLGVGLRQPDHALDVPHSDGNTAIVKV